jgi:hypothetical protein
MKTTTAVGIREDRTDCGPSAATGRSRLEPEISGSGTGHRGAAMMRIAQNEKPACQRAFVKLCQIREHLERAKGLEPSTPTLARSCSTTELHPRPKELAAMTPTTGRAMPKAAHECNRRREPLARHRKPKLARNPPVCPPNDGFRVFHREPGRAAWGRAQRFEPLANQPASLPPQFFPPAGVAIEVRPPDLAGRRRRWDRLKFARQPPSG